MLHLSNAVECASASGQDSEPKNTVEKIGRKLEQNRRNSIQNDLDRRYWELQQETGEAIRMLCQEIDSLKAEISELKGEEEISS